MAYSSNSTINGLEAKTTPVDADSTVIGDSADTNRAKKTTWANIKATLKAYFDTLYSTIASPTFTGTVTTPAIVVSGETASTIASFDASKNIKSLALATYPSLTELSYVKGVTSALQTQLGAKAAALSGTANEIAYFNATTTIASLAVATYPSLTELAYVKGVTSAIQTQLNALSAPIFKNGVATKDATEASTTQNIAHGLGVIPKKIRIRAIAIRATSTMGNWESNTVYNGTTQSSMCYLNGGADSFAIDTSGFILSTAQNSPGTNAQTGAVTFDATNIIITWTKAGSPTGTYTLLWEAET
jgi:hypothetical protein